MLIFATDNNQVAMNRLGICNGMTARWASESLVKGKCDVDDRGPIERGGMMLATRVRLTRLGSQTLAQQWENMIAASGLRAAFQCYQLFGNAQQFADYLTAHCRNATVYIVIQATNGAGQMEGHAVGARITDTECDFFDPNQGLYWSPTNADFQQQVVARLTANGTHMDREIGVWQVR